jgi:hypothetical protein
MAQDVLKIMDDVAAGFPEEDRERLKAVMLGHLGMAMFNGPVESDAQPKENT